MTTITPALGRELAGFEAALATRLATPEPTSLATRRERAFARFVELGWPTTRDERWRFTSVAQVARTAWGVAPTVALAPSDIARMAYPGCRTLVFVNGRYQSALSTPGTQDGGLLVADLATALADPVHAERVLAELGRHAHADRHPFIALNTALHEDAAVVILPRKRVLAEAVHLLFVNVPGPDPVAVHPRVLVIADELAQGTVIENHVGLAGGAYLSTAVTEVVTAPGSVLDIVKLQQESLEASHLATMQSWHDRQSTFRLHSISFGGSLVRNECNGVLDGEGVDATLDGLYLVRGRQHVDHQMRVDHKAAHCNSHELFKGILEDHARSVFNGLIHVHPGAQKTDAKQTNRNLILSKDALANSNPQLEIFADDVKCTHGSTVGQLDEEAVFYLRSRGIGVEAATSLLTYAFAHEVIEGIRLEAVRADLEEFLFRRLPKGDVVRQAV